MYIVQEVGCLRGYGELKVVKSCSYIRIHVYAVLFTCSDTSAAAKMHSVTDRQTDRQTSVSCQ